MLVTKGSSLYESLGLSFQMFRWLAVYYQILFILGTTVHQEQLENPGNPAPVKTDVAGVIASIHYHHVIHSLILSTYFHRLAAAKSMVYCLYHNIHVINCPELHNDSTVDQCLVDRNPHPLHLFQKFRLFFAFSTARNTEDTRCLDINRKMKERMVPLSPRGVALFGGSVTYPCWLLMGWSLDTH